MATDEKLTTGELLDRANRNLDKALRNIKIALAFATLAVLGQLVILAKRLGWL